MGKAGMDAGAPMNGTPAVKSRRNLARTNDRTEWQQAHSEDHPLRYRLHCDDVVYSLKCDRVTLLAEIRETKPQRIERLPVVWAHKHANAVEHLKFMGELELLEVEA